VKDRKARKAFAEWMTAVAARDRLGLTGEGAGRGGLYGAGGADNSASFADRFAAEAGGGAYGAGRLS